MGLILHFQTHPKIILFISYPIKFHYICCSLKPHEVIICVGEISGNHHFCEVRWYLTSQENTSFHMFMVKFHIMLQQQFLWYKQIWDVVFTNLANYCKSHEVP